MKTVLNMEELLNPIADDAPAGEDQRYTGIYDEIREARRADDLIPQGEWEREVKTSDWPKVISLCVDSLTGKTKDLQIAVWLTEALTATEGFSGLAAGFRLISDLLEKYWDTIHPLIEDDDYDYRVAPVEFLNDRFLLVIRQIPLTDPKLARGFSYVKWLESRDVGYESDSKREQRDQKIAEGKITAEEFDSAVAKTSAAFYQEMSDSVSVALEELKNLDRIIDDRFSSHAPSLSELNQLVEDCHRLIMKICREQKGIKDNSSQAGSEDAGGETIESVPSGSDEQLSTGPAAAASAAVSMMPATTVLAEDANEAQVWQQAQANMQAGRFREALDYLLATANSQPSERGRNRYRFLVAKLCLKAGRPELARPIVEQLNLLITELNLEKWESPVWISEILEALYQCLVSEEGDGSDPARAEEIFRKICAMDVTKALSVKR